MKCKYKFFMSISFIVSLTPMFLPQYGGCRGVQEISGLINLFNPIGALSAILFFMALWIPLKKVMLSKFLGLIGCLGIIFSEIYEFLTWHIMTVSGRFSLELSFRFAYPEFYIGLGISVAMLILYLCISYSRNLSCKLYELNTD